MPAKKSSKSTAKAELEIAAAAAELSKEVKKLKSLEFIQVFKHPFKFLWFSFLKGVMIGLGTVFGLTVVLSLLIFLLSKIEFVPIIGEFVSDVIQQIQDYQQ